MILDLLLAVAMTGVAPLPAASAPAGLGLPEVRAPRSVGEAATQALRAEAAEQGLAGARIRVLDPGEEIAIPPQTDWSVSVPPAWLRPRVAVRVQVTRGEVTRAYVVWCIVEVPGEGAVYLADAPRGTLAMNIGVRRGPIDLVRTHGQAALPIPPPGQRLRRAVRAGAPLLVSDFEPQPAVTAAQPVRIETHQGALRVEMQGVALADGAIGQRIPVRWRGASRPIQARVVNHEVVELEQ